MLLYTNFSFLVYYMCIVCLHFVYTKKTICIQIDLMYVYAKNHKNFCIQKVLFVYKEFGFCFNIAKLLCIQKVLFVYKKFFLYTKVFSKNTKVVWKLYFYIILF